MFVIHYWNYAISKVFTWVLKTLFSRGLQTIFKDFISNAYSSIWNFELIEWQKFENEAKI